MTGFTFNTKRPKRSATTCGVTATSKPTKIRLGPVTRSPVTKAGPGVQANDADEDCEADGVEDPECWFGDATECWAYGAQPPEHEPHDQGATAGRPAANRWCFIALQDRPAFNR